MKQIFSKLMAWLHIKARRPAIHACAKGSCSASLIYMQGEVMVFSWDSFDNGRTLADAQPNCSLRNNKMRPQHVAKIVGKFLPLLTSSKILWDVFNFSKLGLLHVWLQSCAAILSPAAYLFFCVGCFLQHAIHFPLNPWFFLHCFKSCGPFLCCAAHLFLARNLVWHRSFSLATLLFCVCIIAYVTDTFIFVPKFKRCYSQKTFYYVRTWLCTPLQWPIVSSCPRVEFAILSRV